VGGTPEVFRQVEQDAQPHPRMIFAGQINDPEALLPYYRSAEALLFPSFYESSGLPPVEAMACGCPVVASEIPALVERCGSAALYCNPKDNEEIHRQVVRLLDDPVLRRFLVAEGLQRCQDFTWESCATQTMERIIEAASLKTKWSGTSASTANISTMP
jgi:glycosyltransferase involved in cell wall biosynthesis